MDMNKMCERVITKKLTDKAKELDVEFQVKCTDKEGTRDLLFRIKRDVPQSAEGLTKEEVKTYEEMIKKQNLFTDYIGEVVIGTFANDIRFSYPSKF